MPFMDRYVQGVEARDLQAVWLRGLIRRTRLPPVWGSRSAVPRPRPQGTSGDGSCPPVLGNRAPEPARGGLVHQPDEPDEPRAVERTINRAALRAELAREVCRQLA